MAQRACVVLSVVERQQLAAIAADRNRPRGCRPADRH
jgi:hypothetical protein